MQPRVILTKLIGWIGDEDLSLEVRIKRVAFSITMLMVIFLGGAMLALALIDISADQKKSHQNSVNLIGEVLSSDIQNKFNFIGLLSNSSLVWTGLTDSSGREAYLRPYLLDQEKNSNISMVLLDYRGRPVLGSISDAIEEKLLGDAIRKVITKNKPKYVISTNNGQVYLLALFPVVFPHSGEPIGALLGKLNLSDMFQRRSDGLAPDLGLDIKYQKAIIGSYHAKATTIYFPAQFDLSIGEATEEETLKLRLYATQNPWLLPIAVRVFLSVLLAALLGALVWRVSEMLAFRLSRRLSALANSCLTKSDGNYVNIPIDSAKDEIGVLSRTLHQTIDAYDQMNTHLEELVKEKTRELSESESHLRAIIEHEPECIKIVDAQGRLTQMNPAGLAMIEADSLEQVANNPVLNVIAPEYRAEFDKMHQRVIAGETAQMEFEVIGLKGGRRWLETHAVPMLDHGQTVHLAVTRDITERKKSEEERGRLLAIIMEAPDFIATSDMQGHLLFLSKAGAKMVGLPADVDLSKLEIKDMHSEQATKQVLEEGIPTVLKRGFWQSENTLLHRDGHEVPVAQLLMVHRDSAGKPIILSTIMRDITEIKQKEAELLRSNTELEQFSYSISHDMRQPLRMISSYMQLLETGLGDQLDAAKREYFNFAIDGAKRMDEMMLGLLEYSRIGRKGEPPTPVDSRALLDEALLFLQPAIAEAQAELRIEGDWPRVLVSRDEMVRLLQNLLGNALKFRVEGRTPEVIVTSSTDGKTWRVSVSDNGIGIIPGQIERLFKVFQRLQSRSAYEGTGIGLALCRKIVEHHGGRIWAESPGESQGCSLIFTLPISSHPDIEQSHV